jgi:hypothetical protein
MGIIKNILLEGKVTGAWVKIVNILNQYDIFVKQPIHDNVAIIDMSEYKKLSDDYYQYEVDLDSENSLNIINEKSDFIDMIVQKLIKNHKLANLSTHDLCFVQNKYDELDIKVAPKKYFEFSEIGTFRKPEGKPPYLGSGMYKSAHILNNGLIKKYFNVKVETNQNQLVTTRQYYILQLRYPELFAKIYKIDFNEGWYIQEPLNNNARISQRQLDELGAKIANLPELQVWEIPNIDLKKENVGYDNNSNLKAFDI